MRRASVLGAEGNYRCARCGGFFLERAMADAHAAGCTHIRVQHGSDPAEVSPQHLANPWRGCTCLSCHRWRQLGAQDVGRSKRSDFVCLNCGWTDYVHQLPYLNHTCPDCGTDYTRLFTQPAPQGRMIRGMRRN